MSHMQFSWESSHVRYQLYTLEESVSFFLSPSGYLLKKKDISSDVAHPRGIAFLAARCVLCIIYIYEPHIRERANVYKSQV